MIPNVNWCICSYVSILNGEFRNNHMLEMTEEKIEPVSWRSTLLKTIIILFLPLAVYVDTGGPWLLAHFNIRIWVSILFFTEPFNFIVFSPPIAVLIAIFLMLPGIYFDRKIQSLPISSSIRRMVIFSATASWLLSYGFTLLYSFNPNLMLDVNPAIFSIPTFSIPIFIIWPILKRELVIRITPVRSHESTYLYLTRNMKQRFGRGRFLPVLIWIGLLFAPIISFNPWGDILFISIFYNALLNTGGSFIPIEILNNYSFTFNLNPLYGLPYVMIFFSLRLLFVRDIYRFNDGRVLKSRLISSGLLAEVAPATILTLIGSLLSGFPQIIFPTPIFPLLGYLYISKSKPSTLRESIWETEEHRMWFEGEPSSPSPIAQPIDHQIKVPISYIVLSRIRNLRRQ